MAAGFLAGCGSSPTSPGPVNPPTTPPTNPPPPPPPGTPATLRISKILAFGDSITYGVDSPPLMLRALDAGISQSYPFKLQSLLVSRYSGQSVSVFNAGIGGKNAWEDRDRLAGMVSETHPDLVLLMEGRQRSELDRAAEHERPDRLHRRPHGRHGPRYAGERHSGGCRHAAAAARGWQGTRHPLPDEVQQRPEDDGVEEGSIHRRRECAVPGVADWYRWPAPDRAGVSAHRRDDVRRYQVALRRLRRRPRYGNQPGAIERPAASRFPTILQR